MMAQKLQDRITPHVTNFSRLRLNIEKQEGKRKYESDGEVMVGEFVCVCVEHLKRCKTSYSFDLVQFYFVLAGASGPSYLPDATKLWYDGGRVN